MLEQIEQRLARIEENQLHLTAHLEQLQERQAATLLAVGWLLANHPSGASLDFLLAQKEELEANPKLVEWVAVLAELAEDVRDWCALSPNTQRDRC